MHALAAASRPPVSEPAPRRLPDGWSRGLARLVLDGAVGLETPAGRVTGPAAYDAVFAERLPAPPDDVSVRALRYASRLVLDDPRRVASRLYTYGSLPRSPRRERQLGAPGAVGALLALGPGTPGLDDYTENPHPHWRGWCRVDSGMAADLAGLTAKLYISPAPEATGDCIRAAVDVFARHRVAAFKVGRDIAGLLRPDKFVAYLRGRDEVVAVAADLAVALRGCPAHGVPFTAPLTADGLLSWGCDPPPVADAPESWRTWVTSRLARAMVAAAAGPGMPVPAWQYAVARLSLDGVEPWTWEPSTVDWQAAR